MLRCFTCLVSDALLVWFAMPSTSIPPCPSQARGCLNVCSLVGLFLLFHCCRCWFPPLLLVLGSVSSLQVTEGCSQAEPISAEL